MRYRNTASALSLSSRIITAAGCLSGAAPRSDRQAARLAPCMSGCLMAIGTTPGLRHGLSQAQDVQLPTRQRFVPATFRAAFRMACPAESAATSRARTEAGRNNEMQCIVADQARSRIGCGEFARQRFQRPRQRIPVHNNHPIRFATADPHSKAMHRHRKFQRLNPFDSHARGILAGKVIELGTIF